MLLLLRRWLPSRDLVVSADSSFAAIELLDWVREHVSVVTRLRMDAALYEPAPVRKVGQHGRPRKKGRRLPTLEEVAKRKATRLAGSEGKPLVRGGERVVEISSGTCVWYHAGLPVVPIRSRVDPGPEREFQDTSPAFD